MLHPFVTSVTLLAPDERLLVAQAKFSRAVQPAERTPSRARIAKAACYNSAIASGCLGGTRWRRPGFTERPVCTAFFFFFFLFKVCDSCHTRQTDPSSLQRSPVDSVKSLVVAGSRMAETGMFREHGFPFPVFQSFVAQSLVRELRNRAVLGREPHPQSHSVLVLLRYHARLGIRRRAAAVGTVRRALAHARGAVMQVPVAGDFLRHGVALGDAAAVVVPHGPAGALQSVRAEHVRQPAFDLDGEAAVQQRVEAALQQGDGLGEGHDGGRDLDGIVAVDPDEGGDEVGRPAHDESGDDGEGHLQRLDLGPGESGVVHHGAAQAAVEHVGLLHVAAYSGYDANDAGTRRENEKC